MYFFVKNITCILLRTLFAAVLIFIFRFAEAQKANYTVKGIITNDSAKAITGCNVKIVSKSGLILAFQNTGPSNTFSINIPFVQDSITVFVSHISYQTFVTNVAINSPGEKIIPVILLHKTDILEKVTITAPPVWVRGDTTFFRAEYYKMGDERKLKDLITKMPGFEIDANGNLLYKKQTVDKIMIDGNELFSDKLKLLVDNFPVHVINTIQAIENQSENKLMKGLTGKKIFVNIGLKNEKLKATFGDGEAGIGTENKYLISPVLFSLYNKVKMGYIGNWNSVGTGIGLREEDELKNENIRDAENFMMNTHSLRLINDLDINSYIVNHEFNNRLQINFPLSKRVNSKTEISFFKDRQTQVTTTQSVLFTDKDVIRRRDSNFLEYRPSVFSLGENLTWNIDSTSQVIVNYLLYKNNSASIINTMFNQQGTLDELLSNTGNRWISNNLKLSYTKRVSETKANTFTGEFSNQHFPQSSDQISRDWRSIFQLPDSTYQFLHTNAVNQFKMIKGSWQTLKKVSKGGSMSYGITGAILNADVASKVFFSSTNHSYPEVLDSVLSNSGTYNSKIISMNFSRQIGVFKAPLSVSVNAGVSNSTINDIKRQSYFTPEYGISLNQRFKNKKIRDLYWSVSFGEKNAPLYQLNNIYLPSSTTSFHNYNYAGETFKYLHAIFSIFSNPANSIVSSVFLIYNHDFSSAASKIRYNQFLSFSTRVISPVSTNLLSLNYTYGFYYRPLGLSITLGTGVDANQGVLFYKSNVVKNSSVRYYFSGELKKNFRIKNYIQLRSKYTSNRFFPAKELTENIYPSVSNLNTYLTTRFAITKKLSAKGNLQWFEQNIFTDDQASFIFGDAELNYHVKNGWFISLKAQNLFNEKFYYSVNNYASGQSFYTVPLVPRSALVSVRFEL
jgi:hypothetical protein